MPGKNKVLPVKNASLHSNKYKLTIKNKQEIKRATEGVGVGVEIMDQTHKNFRYCNYQT